MWYLVMQIFLVVFVQVVSVREFCLHSNTIEVNGIWFISITVSFQKQCSNYNG